MATTVTGTGTTTFVILAEGEEITVEVANGDVTGLSTVLAAHDIEFHLIWNTRD
jgi:hypothetical protein